MFVSGASKKTSTQKKKKFGYIDVEMKGDGKWFTDNTLSLYSI